MENSQKLENEWIAAQRARVIEYLSREGVDHGGIGEHPAFHVHPYVALWQVRSKKSPERLGWWAISGDLPTDYISGQKGANPREALRAISEQWAEASGNMLRGVATPGYSIGTPEEWPRLGGLLQRRALIIRQYAEDDSVWESEQDGESLHGKNIDS